MDRITGAIQYSGKDILNNASIVVRKPYAGLAEEMTYKIVEYFAGIHDRNGQALFYDSQGNTKRNRTEHEIAVTDTVAAVAVAYVAPVVMFQALPIETLKMIFGNR